MRIISLTLLAVFLCLTRLSLAEEPVAATETQPQVANVAYYFYSSIRCASCLKIEKYSHEAIEQAFADRLSNGELVWMMKNIDEEENAHFIDDYNLFTKALVLVRYQDGQQVKWKNCDKIWELLNNETAFKKYVETEVAAFLSE